MKSFTGIILWSILLICSACTDENETNNGKRTDCYNGTPLTVRATATVSIRPRACFSPSYNKVKSQTCFVWLLTLL